ARSRQVRAAMLEQPRPAPAHGRRHHRRAAQDPVRLGQPAARSGPGSLIVPQRTGGCMNDTEAQIIVVGSGMNSLVCAALLAKRGKSVLVLERNDRAGGCIRTEELFPGFHHEVLSSWYPLFLGGAAYPELKDDLAGLGVEFVSNGYTTGVAMPDGRTLALKQDIGDSVNRIEAVAPGDGQAFGAMAGQLFEKDAALTFGLLGNSPYDWKVGRLLFSEWRKRGTDGLLG